MAKQFNMLLKDMSDVRKQRIDTKKQDILYEIDLQGVRKALKLTQNQLAATLKVNQAAVSKMENQSDMFISTLRRFLEAMGANLKIVAEFPDQQIVINQFEELRTPPEVATQ
jgi:transcriptional regulator with XRE-family HTH domain